MVEYILLSIGLNLIPIVIGFIPCLLLKSKRTLKTFYIRLFICFSFFWIFYNILPAILFQFNGAQPTTLLDTTINFDLVSIIGYYLILTVDTIFNIFNFLINTWPLVFVGAPLLAVVILILRLRNEKGKVGDKFLQIGFEFREAPLESIKSRLRKNSWKDEKEFIKLLIVLLPLSLYILIGSLQAVNYPFDPYAPSQALGWFIEVFVVYLLIPITAIHILHVSKVSFQGKFFGERIRQTAFYYLLSVGAVLSALTIILFINLLQTSPNAGATIIYFGSYYIMSAVIFTVFLPIYESISTFLLVKVSNFIKGKEITDLEDKKPFLGEKRLYTIIFGALTFFIIIILTSVLSIGWGITPGADPAFFLQDQFQFQPLIIGPSLFEQISLEANIILSYAFTFIGIGIWSGVVAFFARIFPMNKYIVVLISFILSFIITVLNIGLDVPFIFGQSSFFVIPAPAQIIFNLGNVFVPRAALLQVDYLAAFGIASTPFYIFRSLCSGLLLTSLLYYWGRPFKSEKFELQYSAIEIIYSKIDFLPSLNLLKNSGLYYSLSVDQPVSLLSDKKDLSKIYKLLSKKSYDFDKLVTATGATEKEVYIYLKSLIRYKSLGIYRSEFFLPFYRANLKGLFVVSQDGRNLFSYQFSEETSTEPVLVAGMLSAISSFVKETTKSRDLLRSIDHGDTTLMINYGKYSFAALLADRETTDLRNKLQTYIKEFENRHQKTLLDWNGDVDPFEIEKKPVKEMFID